MNRALVHREGGFVHGLCERRVPVHGAGDVLGAAAEFHHRHGFGPRARGENGERNTTRVQLELPPQAMERLQRLREKTEAASYAEVIRNALRVFEALVDEHTAGAEFSLKRPNGETVAYKIFV